MKKFVSIILTLALSLTNTVFFASAETEPVSVTLIAPPTGVASVVENVLPDGKYTIVEAPEGVFVNGGNIAMDGSNIEGGDYTVADENGDTVANVSISPYIYYEDFEDGTVGEAVTTTKLKKISDSAEDTSMFVDVAGNTTAVIADDGSGNKYGLGDGDYNNTPYEYLRTSLAGIDAASSGKVTISAKIRRKNGDGPAYYPGIMIANSSGQRLIEFKFAAATTACNVNTNVKADGSSVSGAGTNIGGILTSNWLDVKFELDLSNGTYNAKFGNTIALTDYKMDSRYTYDSLGYIDFGVRVDDIAVYSGENTDITIKGDTPEYITVSQDKTSMIPLDVTVEPFGISPEWDCETEGVSIVDGFICVEPNTTASEAEITAEAFGETENFTIALNPALEGDMASGSVNISERAVFNAKVKDSGTLSLLTDNGSLDIDVSAGSEEWSELEVYVDLNKNNYIAVLNKEVIEEVSFDANTATGFEAEDLLLNDVYLGSAYEALPKLFDVVIDGAVMCDEIEVIKE